MKNKSLASLLSLLLIGGAISISSCGKGDVTTTPTTPIDTPTTPTPGTTNPGEDTTPVGPTTSAPLTGDTWKVSFDYNYENKFKNYLTVDVLDGEKVEKPADPLRQGYDFVAWYDDPYCRSQYLWDFETPIRQSMTLYANWELNGEEITDTDYVITYQSQLGTSYVPVDGANLIYTAEYGDMVRFKINVDTENYVGEAVVTANGEVITPDEDGVYSFAVTSNVTFEISGLTKISNAYKVYYENPHNWTDVYIYMWDTNSVGGEGSEASTTNAPWPGERMSYDGKTGMYYYEIESVDDCTYNNVIFNNNNGEQTSDLTLMLGYSTNATLYSGELTTTVASEFDPNSTTAQITWTESDDYTFLTVDGEEGLTTHAEIGETVSFTIRIDIADYTGEPKVLVNGEEITAIDGVYSFEITSLRYTVKVTNIMAAGMVEIYYTLPQWNPVAYNPKIYYWGTDENGAAMSNTINWDSGAAAANDKGGAMTLVSGNEYKYEIDLKSGQVITGIIVIMYQDDQGAIANKKQSRDVPCNITSAGAWTVTFAEGWEQNSFGEWCFGATIAERG